MNKKIKMSAFQSSDNIQTKEGVDFDFDLLLYVHGKDSSELMSGRSVT